MRNGSVSLYTSKIPRRTKLISRRAGTRCLPHNTRIINLLGDAFANSRVPLSQFSIDIRRWDGRSISGVEQLKNSHFFGGFLFEGGTDIISHERHYILRIDNFAEGIAWILANTNKRIFVMMPGFWEREQMPTFLGEGRTGQCRNRRDYRPIANNSHAAQ